MRIEKAIALSVGELTTPVISDYQLGAILYKLYKEKKYNGEALNVTKNTPQRNDYLRYLHSILNSGLLKELKPFNKRAFTILGNTINSARDIACSLDPFCYISHLSAMEYHGLTDRIPVKLYIYSPSPPSWREAAKERMLTEVGAAEITTYIENGLPYLRKPKLEKLNQQEIKCHHSTHKGSFIKVKGEVIRVATIGKTFLDMLQTPDLCGGMRHVIEVFQEHGEIYIPLIINELNQHGKIIDKVRAGYILEDLCDIQDDAVEAWTTFAQRGGSRKLDPSADYHNKWSEKWQLSLNLF